MPRTCNSPFTGTLPKVALAVLLGASVLSAGCSTGSFSRSDTVTYTEAEASPSTPPTEAEQGNPYLQARDPIPSEALSRFAFTAQAMSQSSWDIAEQGLVSLVADYPQLSGPCLNLALVYQHAGDTRQAEHWYKQGIARNSNNLLAYNQYAIFLREQGRFDQAEEIYLKALAVWEPHAQTHRNIGILYDLYRGDKKAALQHFYRYQELQDEPNRVMAGWIADLERQLTAVAGRE